jgi:phosphoribosylformylglycinamidine cyclo-ligase
VLEEAGASVTGIIHSSGGGQVKCRNFGKGLHYVKDELLPAPPIFRTIEEAARVPRDQMYETFNMGQRLEVYCDPGATDKIIGISRSLGVMAQIIGRVEASTGDSNQVTITDAQGMYTY